MTASISSILSAVTWRRFGMPALLTRTSMPPSSSSARRPKSATPSSSLRSTAQLRLSGACSWQLARTSASRSARRAQMPTVAPARANPTARSAPMPDDAPVTRTLQPATLYPTPRPPRSLRRPTADFLATVAKEIEALGRRTVTGPLDVREPDEVRGFLDLVRDELDHVDILVNNAGGGFYAAFFDVSEKGQSSLVRENFDSVTHFV